MKGLITWSVDNPTAINVFMVALLVVGGAVTAKMIPRESFPKIELDIVTVRVVWRGHTPEEVEEAIVIKVEEAIYAIEGIESLTSTATHGVGGVHVELASGRTGKRFWRTSATRWARSPTSRPTSSHRS